MSEETNGDGGGPGAKIRENVERRREANKEWLSDLRQAAEDNAPTPGQEPPDHREPTPTPEGNPLIPAEEHRLRESDGAVRGPTIELRPDPVPALLNDGLTAGGQVSVGPMTDVPRLPFSDDRKVRYVELLARYGLKSKVAKAIGTTIQTVNYHEKHDPDFAEATSWAMDVFRDSIEEVIQDRAIHGWKEPVFSQRLGCQIGEIHRFDNKLLELLAKRHIPAYRDKQQVDHTVTGGVLIGVDQAPSPEDWEQKHKRLAEESREQPEVVDAEVIEGNH